MKITFVLPGPLRKPAGGYKVVYQYANIFAKLGHRVDVVHVDDISFKKFTLKSFVKHVLIGLNFLGENIIKWFKFDENVNVKCVTNFNPDNFSDADAIIATAWQTAKPVFFLPENKGRKYYFIQHYEIQHGHKKEVDATWKLPMTNIVIATWLRDVGKSLGVDCKVVKNFVDKNEYYLTNPMKKRVSSVSMLYHNETWKGSADGIKAINLVLKDYPNLDVRIFGVPNRPNNLNPKIKYFKNCNVEELREEIYNRTSIFLFPSHTEGWGLTATEAMACGNALVSTNNGGVLDFGIEGRTALLSDVGDVNHMANNIEKLIRNKNLREKLQKNSVDFVNDLTIESSAKKFIDILKN